MSGEVKLTIGIVGKNSTVAIVDVDFPGIGPVGYVVLETGGVYTWLQSIAPVDGDPVIATIKKSVYKQMKNTNGKEKTT